MHPLRIVTERLLVHLELLVVLGVHEVVRARRVVQVFQLVRFHRRRIDGIRRAEPMLEVRARAQVLELRLHHRPQVARGVMPKLGDTARLALEDDHHAPADLGCWNGHDRG